VAIWLSGAITLEGQWTLYTARCSSGRWDGDRCTGNLVAAERWLFAANKAIGEVDYTALGRESRTGRLSQCLIQDGRDWACERVESGAPPITNHLVRGSPVGRLDTPDGVRPVPKWRWLALSARVPTGSDVSVR
jgi:hypothetical protein